MTDAMISGGNTPWPDTELERTVMARVPRGGMRYAELHREHRLLQDRLAGAALPDDVSAVVTDQLRRLNELLQGHQVPEIDRHDGLRSDLPGRGLPLSPPYVIDALGESTLRGRVTLTRYYLGGNGAAHGGTQPLLFDELLGKIVNHRQPGVARTASLTVNYRKVTPLDVELFFDVSRDRVEGRKRWGSGRLFGSSGELLADCTALFLQLLPGQS